MKNFIHSILHALSGIYFVTTRQRNFRIMIAISIVVIIFSFIFDLTIVEWFFILWTIATVLISEMVNTATEHVLNLIYEKKNIRIKLAKDIAAGAVLLSVIWAVVVGTMIFVPKILGVFI